MGLTGGMIDATDYLDENVYANDEFTQFMNEVLVNGPHAFFPSYDLGGALEWEMGRFGVKGIVMNVGENDDGRSFHFYGIQVSYNLETAMGEGNYRLILDATSKDFLDREGINRERRKAVIISCDQAFGDVIGGWLRFGTQTEDAAVDYDALYSGGIHISGKIWGREQDNIGIGYAYLDGGNGDAVGSHVAEVYARFVFNEYLAFTADIQYMKDKIRNADDARGFLFGARMVAEF